MDEELLEHVKKIKEIRMRELFAVIKSSGKTELLEKFGVVLLQNQMIEENLRNLIKFSNSKNGVTTKLNLDVTFGKLISLFEQYVIRIEKYDYLDELLEECRSLRNTLIHNIFEIEYFFDIVEVVDECIIVEEKILEELDMYWIKIEEN